jgi:regulator of sigma E protease
VQTARMSALTLNLMYRMVLGDVSVKNISGPIQIAQVAGYSASSGLVTFLLFIAIMSVSLAVLNLLPVPVLDGGHLLYYVVELVKGSPLSDRAQMMGQQVGLTLLIALMGLAFYNDILRILD